MKISLDVRKRRPNAKEVLIGYWDEEESEWVGLERVYQGDWIRLSADEDD